MITVSGNGAPFKIFKATIALYAVLVIDVGKFVWVWNKGQCNQSMDGNAFPRGVFAYYQLRVSGGRNARFADTSAIVFGGFNASHSAHIRNFIKSFVTGYRKPMFSMHVFSYNTICQ